MRPVSTKDVTPSLTRGYADYLDYFVHRRDRFAHTMAGFGLGLSADTTVETRIAGLREHLAGSGACFRNNGKSVSFGELSPACIRCRTGVKSVSEFISLACHRSCWFCFNENQCDFQTYRTRQKDWRGELSAFQKSMGGLDFIALTGGEPLLHPEETCAFFTKARHDNPSSHLRLYTSGDQLTSTLLTDLARAGLDEIRFSVKLDDGPERRRRTMERIHAAVSYIPTVMVEMPVIPGTHDVMTALLQELEDIGAFGINLLELCFPLHHPKSFEARGLELRPDPFTVLYDYGYAGALPIQGSEELALQLMSEEIDRGTRISLHYCSLENKNTAQVYEQNEGGRRDIPLYRFSRRNFFYETLRCFGPRALELADALDRAGCPHGLDPEGQMLQFSPGVLDAVRDEASAATLFCAYGIIERDDSGAARFREVDAHVLEPGDVDAMIGFDAHCSDPDEETGC